MSALYTREDRMAKIDWELLADQKEWLYEQLAELEPTGTEATHSVEGILNLLNALEDACTAESCEAAWYMEEELDNVPVNHEKYDEEMVNYG